VLKGNNGYFIYERIQAENTEGKIPLTEIVQENIVASNHLPQMPHYQKNDKYMIISFK